MVAVVHAAGAEDQRSGRVGNGVEIVASGPRTFS